MIRARKLSGTDHFIVYAQFNSNSIRAGLGRPGYSSHFICSAFEPVLRRFGAVTRVADLAAVDEIHDRCVAAGDRCTLLCFTPPHLAPLTLRCPTIPVFGWDFTTIPCESWDDDPRHDWRVVFRHCGRVITLSRQAAGLVRGAMGKDFPVFSIPAPVFEAFQGLPAADPERERQVNFRGAMFDTAADARFLAAPPLLPVAPPAPEPPAPAPALEPEPESEAPPDTRLGTRARISVTVYYAREWYRLVLRDVLPAPVRGLLSLTGRLGYRLYRLAVPAPAHAEPDLAPAAPMPEVPPEPAGEPEMPAMVLRLRGVAYVTMCSPEDWCKGWNDSVSAFIWAFRDNPAATLVLKMPPWAAEDSLPGIAEWLFQLAPFRCRIVLLFGYLEPSELAALVSAAQFYINSSACEGAGLPVMEFLSAGRPVIAPDHSAMADYVTERNAFIPRGSLEHNIWPHDPRRLFTTMRHRLDWSTIKAALEASFALATAPGDGYALMAARAEASMRRFCGAAVVEARLRAALELDVVGESQEAAE